MQRQKNELKPHLRNGWVIPPEQSADGVADIEEVLDVYHRPYAPYYPVVCMDQQPVQMVKETRESIPCKPGKPLRSDYQYQQPGRANAFMFCEPLAGNRSVAVREQRTATDWAQQIKKLLDDRYAHVKKLVWVLDNLNTHNTASLYKTFRRWWMCNAVKLKIVEIIKLSKAVDCPKCGSSQRKKNG